MKLCINYGKNTWQAFTALEWLLFPASQQLDFAFAFLLTLSFCFKVIFTVWANLQQNWTSLANHAWEFGPMAFVKQWPELLKS